METRRSLDEKISKHVDMTVLPQQYHATIKDFLAPTLDLGSMTKSDLIRRVCATKELMCFLRKFPQTTLASFFRCSTALLSRIFCEPPTPSGQYKPLTRGRPKLLSDEHEQAIVEWVRQRCEQRDWPTVAAFKERVLVALEDENRHITPSVQYFYDLQERLMGGLFCVKSASGMEVERFAVRKEDVLGYFEELERLEITKINPKLIINIDETGFGASKSGRIKPQKVIVPIDFQGSPVFKASEEKRFVTCLAATNAYGYLLTPGLIADRQYDCQDAQQCSFFGYCLRYFSPKAFVSKDIFGHFVMKSIFPYIMESRREMQDPEAPAVILFDGHKSHLSDVLNAKCAAAKIMLVVIPPHSSHLLQPLDQLIFYRMKREFSQFGKINGLSKISSTLERVWASYQACSVLHVVHASWRHTGIVPVLTSGKCTRVQLNKDIVLENSKLNHVEEPNEHSRGRRAEDAIYGALNEDEYLIYDAKQCPLCCQPLQ